MLFLTTVKNAILQTPVVGKTIRSIVAMLFGPNDVKQAPEISPAGYDGSPDTGITAVFAKTGKRGSTVFLGYVNSQQKALPGERRIFFCDASGNEVAKIWGHNNGTIEIGGLSSSLNTKHPTINESLQIALTDYFALQNAAILAASGGYLAPPPINISTAAETNILIP